MRIVVVIPARSKSRSIKDKNLQLVGGKPLLAYPILTAKHSTWVPEVYVSTDSEEYAKVAESYGAKGIMRPKHLAEDTPTEWVTWHACSELNLVDNDVIITMQPTTPLVNSADLDRCIDLMVRIPRLYDSVISVVEVKEYPAWMFTKGKYLKPAFADMPSGSWGIRQTLGKLVRPSGAIYVTKVGYLRENFRLIADKCGFVEMPFDRSMDIDSEYDLKLIRAWVEKYGS